MRSCSAGNRISVEVFDRVKDLGVAEMRIAQRRNLCSFLSQKVDFLVVQPPVSLSPVGTGTFPDREREETWMV